MVRILLLASLLVAAAGAWAVEPHCIRVGDVNAAPVRNVAEWLGADVLYTVADGGITISRDEHSVVLSLYATGCTVDDKAVTLPFAPFVCNGVAYAPVRILAEPFGCTLAWGGSLMGGSVMIARAEPAGELKLPIYQELQTVTADFDGDGAVEVAYASCLNLFLATFIERPEIPARLWIMRGSRMLWEQVVPNDAVWHIDLDARDITGDGHLDILVHGEFWGSGQTNGFAAYGWNGRAYGPLLRTGDDNAVYLTPFGSFFVRPQGKEKPAVLIGVDLDRNGNRRERNPFVAEWYTWNGECFAVTRTRATKKRYFGPENDAALKELGLAGLR